jgi:hypothetical protein
MVFLGFSVLAEHAHQNQGRPHILSLLDQRTNANHKHGRGIIQNKHAIFNIDETVKSPKIVIPAGPAPELFNPGTSIQNTLILLGSGLRRNDGR